MAGSNMKDIRHRIKSVENTMQITKAMELVASSKLRRAKERAESSRPFFNILYQTISDIAADHKDFSSIYTSGLPIHKPLYIVIAGDRGLAGGYNANIFKLVAEDLKEASNAKVIAIGRKAVEYFAKQPDRLFKGFSNVAENFDGIDAFEITDLVLDLFRKKEIDGVFLYYTNFVSALSQLPSHVQVLPLHIDFPKDVSSSRVMTVYDPSPEEVFDQIVPQYIAGMLIGAVAESYASEQGARRTAMESANDNAEEMIADLSLKYNRARQGTITQEITEIVAGAQALN